MIRHMVCLILLSISLPAWAHVPHTDGTINAVVGDASWTSPEPGGERERIRAHLGYVVRLLERADVSRLTAAQLARRTTLLAELRDYTTLGVFPRRAPDDGQGLRRPRFIDDRGVHCAVGELIRRSGHPELARMIDQQAEFAYVAEMNFPELSSWAAENGFTATELAMIQPAYSSPPTEQSVKRRIEELAGPVTLECAAHPVPAGIKLRIRGDEHGNITVDGREDSPFAACFVEALRKHHLGSGGAWDSEPRPFRDTVKLKLMSPKRMVKARLEQTNLSGLNIGCTPRPGPLARKADVTLKVDAEAVTFGVQTTPSNEEVDRCLQAKLREMFRDIKPGVGDFELRATKDLGVTVTTARLREVLPHYAKTAGLRCWEDGTSTKRKVTVVAKPGADAFEIVSPGGSTIFEACFLDQLQQHLRSDVSVSRKLPDGTYERYFRIDGEARVEMTIELMTPQENERQRERMRKELDRHRYDF